MDWQPQIRNGQIAIACSYFRGGTSKGPVFLASDLPADSSLLERILLAATDAPHVRQVDGIGGPETLSNKVVIVSPSTRTDADIDYRFIQLVPGSELVDHEGTCGNMLTTVAPFAVEAGLVQPSAERTSVAIYALNTRERMTAVVQTPNGKLTYRGTTCIAGVTRPAAPVEIIYHSPFGNTVGTLLPTDNSTDVIDGVPVTIIDAGGLAVIFSADAIGLSGCEDKATLDSANDVMARIESLRRAAGTQAGISNPAESFFPKPIMISPPQAGGSVTSRDLTSQSHYPAHCHAAHSLSGAIGLATACVLKGSVANVIANPTTGNEVRIVIEHPSGELSICVNLDTANGHPVSVAAFRTCRKLWSGDLYVDQSVLS